MAAMPEARLPGRAACDSNKATPVVYQTSVHHANRWFGEANWMVDRARG